MGRTSGVGFSIPSCFLSICACCKIIWAIDIGACKTSRVGHYFRRTNVVTSSKFSQNMPLYPFQLSRERAHCLPVEALFMRSIQSRPGSMFCRFNYPSVCCTCPDGSRVRLSREDRPYFSHPAPRCVVSCTKDLCPKPQSCTFSGENRRLVPFYEHSLDHTQSKFWQTPFLANNSPATNFRLSN